jgi:cell division transport system permease protein
MGENAWLVGVSLSILTVSLVIAGAYLSLCLNLGQASRRLTTGAVLVLVLGDEVKPRQAEDLAADIRRWPGVAGASFVPQHEALQRFRRQLGPHAGLLDGLHENPLPDAVEVYLQPWASAEQEVVPRAKRLVQVREVITSRPWLHRLEEAFRALGRFSTVLGVLLFLGLVLIACNVVRLAVYARRHELRVMELVGASPSYISRPFLIEAVILGLAAAGVASLLLWLLFALFGSSVELPLGVRLKDILYLPRAVPPCLALAGALSGLLGGIMGVGRASRTEHL